MRYLSTIAFALLSIAAQAADPYAKAYRNALADELPLVVYVGCEARPIPGAWCCSVAKLEGYAGPCAVLSVPAGEKMVYLRTFAAGEAVKLPAIDPTDALDNANRERAARGLPPFLRDDGLTIAAKAAATYRAANGIEGHVQGGMGDFQFLPSGSSCGVAGCACWPAGMGFGACELYGNYRYAGAATVKGVDGREYHHLFIR